MLAALVLAGIIAAPAGTGALLIQARRRARTSGVWPTLRRLFFAIAGTAVLGALVVGAMRLLGDSEHVAVEAAAALAFQWAGHDHSRAEHLLHVQSGTDLEQFVTEQICAEQFILKQHVDRDVWRLIRLGPA